MNINKIWIRIIDIDSLLTIWHLQILKSQYELKTEIIYYLFLTP